MIIVRLQGGLGNQLFQYSFARSIAWKLNTSLYFDVNWYLNKHREYPFELSLLHFNTVVKVYPRIGEYIYKKLLKIEKLNKIFSFIPNYISEENFSGYKLISMNNLYFDGYWENYILFSDYNKNLLNEFTLKSDFTIANKLYVDSILSSNSVSVHLRGGPYLNDPNINVNYEECTPDYFNKAFNFIRNKVENPLFFVFSNDNIWAKKYLNYTDDIVFIENEGPDYEHLIMMSLCKHNIIVNSTFSWWGAWLNKNRHKIVVAPIKWFRGKKENIKYPISWVRIKN